jgi:hypothetical protein
MNKPGAGEFSGTEKLYLLVQDKETVTIYRELQPLKNSYELPELEKIAAVNPNDLFKVLKLTFQYRELSYEPTVKSIQWSSAYQENGFTFIPGTAKSGFGTFNFLIKLGPKSIPQLITMKSAGSAEIKPIEEKLFLLQNPLEGTTTLLKERIPLLNNPAPLVIQKITTVDTSSFAEWKNNFTGKIK